MYDQLVAITSSDRVKCNESMSRHTTFRIGGPADYFIVTKSSNELKAVVELCNRNSITYMIIGNGSNILVSDSGIRGVVIKMSEESDTITCLSDDKFDGYKGSMLVQVAAGTKLSKAAMDIAELGLTGFEFAAGIPGTLGGAVVMNAGAYGGEIKDYIVSAKVMMPDGTIIELSKNELKLGYRTSAVMKENLIVLSAVFSFQSAPREEILKHIEEMNHMRREKQPLEYPSAGSTFKRPEGCFAGKLIMEAGLRGYRVNDAQVSEKHCGFVINTGSASACDVKHLIDDVISIVKNKTGITLEPEIKILGEI